MGAIRTRVTFLISRLLLLMVLFTPIVEQFIFKVHASTEIESIEPAGNLFDEIFGRRFRWLDTRTTVITVESDFAGGVSRIDITRDLTGALTSLVFTSPGGTSLVYSFNELRQKPQVLKRMDGHDIILVSVEKDFTLTRGGHANMRYLANGVVGDYKNFRMLIDTQGAGIVLRVDTNFKDPDSDHNRSESIFNYLFLEKNTVLGKVVGISKVIAENR